MNLKKVAGIAAGVMVGITLLACGGSPGEGTKAPHAATPQATGEAPEPAKEDGPVIAQLGSKGLIFKDEQIDVAISKPGTYKRGAYADKVPAGSKAFVVVIEVINHSPKAINVNTISLTASLGEAAAEMDAIFDTDAGLKGTPDTALLPGKTAKFKYGFVGPTTEAHPVININVSPWELGNTTGLFQGKL